MKELSFWNSPLFLSANSNAWPPSHCYCFHVPLTSARVSLTRAQAEPMTRGTGAKISNAFLGEAEFQLNF